MNETDQAAQDGNPAQTIQPRRPESGRTGRAQSAAILQGFRQIMIPARPTGEPVGQFTGYSSAAEASAASWRQVSRKDLNSTRPVYKWIAAA